MKKYSLYTNLILFGCALCIIPLAALGFFSHMKSSQAIQQQVNESNKQWMQQMNGNVEQVLKTLDNSLNQAMTTDLMMKAIYNPLEYSDFQTYFLLRKQLSYPQSFDAKATDIILANFSNNWLINNTGLYTLDEVEDINELYAYLDLPHQSNWILQSKPVGSEETVTYQCNYTISLVKKLPVHSVARRGIIAAHIPMCSLAAMMDNQPGVRETMIVAPDHSIIVHPNSNKIGMKLEEIGYIEAEKLALLEGSSGQFQTKTENGRYTATFVRSKFNDWLYVSFIELDQATREARAIGWFTFYVCLAIILISIGFVWLGSRRIYTPIRGLVNAIMQHLPNVNGQRNELQLIGEHIHQLFHSNNDLKNELHQNSQLLRTFLLNRLYEGTLNQHTAIDQIEMYGYLDLVNQWDRKCVLTLQIDLLDQSRYESKDQDLLLFAINNIVEETIPAANRIPPIIIQHTQVSMVGNSGMTPEQFNSWTIQLSEQIKQNVQNYLSLDVSIGISLPFNSLFKASRAYREGLEALKHRLTLGKGVIVQYASINSGQHTLIYPFPKQIADELLDAIKLADQTRAAELLEQWMNEVFRRERSLHDYQISLIRLLNDLMIVLQEAGISLKQIYSDESSVYDELLKLYVRDEIEHWFRDKLILPMVQIFGDRRRSQFHNLSERMIEMIHKEYDTELTLEECAARLHYNAFYLSSVFKKETNQSFSDYLSAYRMNMAKKWLTESDMSVKDIAQRLQYNNSQNFIRSFRKQTDMTPGQYRTKYGKTDV